MFHRSLISIARVLQESDLLRLLEKFGAEVITSSNKSFSFDGCGSSNLQTISRTYVTSNKYTIRYQGENFALSYSTVEEKVTKSKSKTLGSSKTYICVVTTNISLNLLQRLAHYFDTSTEMVNRTVSNWFIRNLLPS